MKTRSLLLALASAGTLLCSASAHAGGHVSWSIGINAPVVGAVVSSVPAYPVYAPAYEPYPVYAPAPVYVAPPPVYVRPAPVLYGPPAYYYPRHHGYYRPVPVEPPYPRRHWR